MAAPPIVERHKHHFHRQSPIKESVRAATTANIAIATALNNGDSLDGVTLATGDRVLVKDQSTGSQNGIYVVGASPARDYDVSTDDPAWGFVVLVREGTANEGTLWLNTNTTPPDVGTDALTFTQFAPSTGGSGTLPWFNVVDYGATGDGSTDDTVAVNAAIAALNSAGSGVLYFPAGVYKCTSALTTITVQCLVLGDGGGRTDPASEVFQTSASADLFTFSSEGVTIRDLYLTNTSGGATTSRAIVNSAGGWMFIRDCGIILFKDGIDLEAATYYHIAGCYISNVRYGVRIRNTAAPDNGDGSVIDNIIIPNASGSGFRLESAGGLRFIGNKVNANDAASSTGIDIAIGSITTASLVIDGNSIENCKASGISFTASGTGSWTGWVISNNQFGFYNNTAGNCIVVSANTADSLLNGVISDNIFQAISNANPAVTLTKAKNVRLSGNVQVGWGSLFSQTTCTGIVDDSGAVAAGVLITGTPSSGQVPVASSGTAAAWGTATAAPTGAAGGDLSGTYPNPSVTDDSHSHTASTIDLTGEPAGGDLSGTYPNPSVVDDSHSHTAATVPSGTGDHEHMVDQFVGDGSTTAFELTDEPLDPEAVVAFVAGAETAVTLSGTMNTTCTFGAAPSAAARVIVTYPATAA